MSTVDDACFVATIAWWVDSDGIWISAPVKVPHDLKPSTTEDDEATCVYCGKVMTRDRAGGGSGD